MKLLFLMLLLGGAQSAFAQRTANAIWFNADYTYDDLSYSEPNFTQKGHFAGVRGDLGLALASWIGVSAGGEYMDGNLNFNGDSRFDTTIAGISRDYIRDLRGMLHLFYGPIVLAGGIAQREHYDSNGTYRERQFYSYYPTTVTLYRGSFYLRGEADLMSKGHSHVYASDLGSGHEDVDLNFTQGTGYGGEIGAMVPSAFGFYMRIFVAYHRWDIEASDTVSDGTSVLSVPKNSTTVVSGGLGISF